MFILPKAEPGALKYRPLVIAATPVNIYCVEFTDPLTSNLVVGVLVPIPTFDPLWKITLLDTLFAPVNTGKYPADPLNEALTNVVSAT